MDTLTAIRARRSVRRFTADAVSAAQLAELVDAARWAPSGLNNQPWRFALVLDPDTREALARRTKYSAVLRSAPAAIAVFLDHSTSYHRDKDLQAIGAAIQNLLLAAHSRGLATCWLGEILNRREEVERLLQVPATLELMAVVAVGHAAPGEHGKPDRSTAEDLVIASP